jgi:hypothetical protein
VIGAARRFARGAGAAGPRRRSGRVALAAPTNVRANDPDGDRVGESQTEVAVAVHGDTVVVAWNDSKGFTPGDPRPFTVTGFAWSTDGGASFVDGGDVPRLLPTDQALGDCSLDTDEQGHWYLNSLYTRAAGAPGPVAEQDIAVWYGRFDALGQLAWDPPSVAATGTAATGLLDKCLLAVDRVTGIVHVAYTRFNAAVQIEVVRSTSLGAYWTEPVVLDDTAAPTTAKQAARPIVGPDGEVYVVWEKGANFIDCPDGVGEITNTQGWIAFSRSADRGFSYSPFQVIGTVDHSWTWSGPGDNRERANQFPDIAVDRSGGPYRGRLYVTWHEAAPWTVQLIGGTPYPESQEGPNDFGGSAERVVPGSGLNISGSLWSDDDVDFYAFDAVEGADYLFNLDPQGFNCGVTGTSFGMRLRLYADAPQPIVGSAFMDSLLAASSLGRFAQRIVWTAPRSGRFLLRVSRSSGTAPFEYLLRIRTLTFGTPNPARDARDVVFVRSDDGGTTWTAERRLGDPPAGLEERRPFAACDGTGGVHVFWHDSRDPGLGSNAVRTGLHGTSSRDGGETWTPDRPIADETSFFSFNTLAIPNLGDYNTAAGFGDFVVVGWSDHRSSAADVLDPQLGLYTAGEGPDAYTARVRFAHEVECPSGQVAQGGGTASLDFLVRNTGTMPDRYDYVFSEPLGWLTGPAAGTTAELAPGATAQVGVTLALPGGCSAADLDTVRLQVTPVGAGFGTRACTAVVGCSGQVSAEASPAPLDLRLAGASPFRGSTTIAFHLPARGAARLEVFDIRGQRVRVLADGEFGPGLHQRQLSSASGGARLPPGLYLVRLRAAGEARHLRVIALD